MDTVSLDVKTRDMSKKAKMLLEEGMIPAVYYGRGIENQHLQLGYQDFRKVYRHAGGNTVIVLNIEGKKKVNVLVHDLTYDPITSRFTHIDFINVRMDEEISTEIPLSFVGVSSAVKDFSGTLVEHLSTLLVKCLPKDLPHAIEINIEPLVDFHASIHVGDVLMPEGVVVLHEPEELIVNVSPPREEKEEEVVEVAEGQEGVEKEGADGVEDGGSEKE